MSDFQEQVDDLAKILKDLEPEKWAAVKKTVDDLKGVVKEEPAEKQSRPKIVLSEGHVAIMTNNLAVSVDKVGEVTCSSSGEVGEDPTILLPVKELKLCLKHIIGLNNADLCKLRDSWVGAEKEEKIRYINKTSRKAFAYGLVIGSKR